MLFGHQVDAVRFRVTLLSSVNQHLSHRTGTKATGNSSNLAVPMNPAYTDTNNLHYALCKALVAGNASSLPLHVLRSLLKQRRILMRMH